MSCWIPWGASGRCRMTALVRRSRRAMQYPFRSSVRHTGGWRTCLSPLRSVRWKNMSSNYNNCFLTDSYSWASHCWFFHWKRGQPWYTWHLIYLKNAINDVFRARVVLRAVVWGYASWYASWMGQTQDLWPTAPWFCPEVVGIHLCIQCKAYLSIWLNSFFISIYLMYFSYCCFLMKFVCLIHFNGNWLI